MTDDRVTRRTPTDQQLLQQTLLGEALDNAPFAVFVFDEDRQNVAVNRAACELTGYTRQELLDLDVFAVSDRPERAAKNLREVSARRRTSGRAKIKRKDGKTLAVSYRIGETSLAGAYFFISLVWPTG